MKLIISDEDKRDWNIHTDIMCIYKITNLINGKVYIGQSVNFRKRVSDYENLSKKKVSNRPISKAIRYYGSDNFTIEILERCGPDDDINEREKFYIKKYDASNPEKGYNVNEGNRTKYTSISRELKSKAHTGLKESADVKRKKSNYIIAIKDNMIIIADSGKLFGDYIGKSKDMIKNALREPSTINGYYLYYEDDLKRHEILIKMLKKRSIRNKQYMKYMSFINDCESESVETIYSLLTENIGKIYELKYENITESGELFLTEFVPVSTEIKEELYEDHYRETDNE